MDHILATAEKVARTRAWLLDDERSSSVKTETVLELILIEFALRLGSTDEPEWSFFIPGDSPQDAP